MTASGVPSCKASRTGYQAQGPRKPSSWLELSVTSDEEGAEAVANLFQRFGYGVAIEGTPASPLWDDVPPSEQLSKVAVRTYLPVNKGSQRRKRDIEVRLALLSLVRPVSPLKVRELAPADWENAWKEFFPVHHIGRVVIKPTWLSYDPSPYEVVLELDPGMAFGTGLHPTTQLCLLALEKYLQKGDEVLDLGTGSGILAIAAAKLGAGRVVALDTDPVAVRVCKVNVKSNGAQALVAVRRGSLPLAVGRNRFDLIVANISSSVIVELAAEMFPLIKSEGLIVLSGFLDTQLAATLAPFNRAGFREQEIIPDADWRTVVLRASS